MSVDGTWNLTIKSPMGIQKSTLELTSHGSEVAGTMASDADSEVITDTSYDGETLSWKIKLRRPMPITLTFSAQVDGDTLEGTVKMGRIGTSKLIGERSSS